MAGISLILAALVAGAGTGVGSVAAKSIQDAYEALREALKRKLADDPEAEAAIEGYLAAQDGCEELLRAALQMAEADRDEDIMSAAMAIVGTADPRVAPKYSVLVINSSGVQVGDKNKQKKNIIRRDVA